MKHNKRTYLALAAAPLLALALFAGNAASAHGWMLNADPDELARHQQDMFQRQATLLNTTVDVVKNAWAQGKGTRELAQELGINDADLQNKMREQHKAELKGQLQTLVQKGVITQAQADQRYAALEQRLNQVKAGRGMRGMFGHRGWGM